MKDVEKLYIYIKRNGHRIVSESQTIGNKVEQGINSVQMSEVLQQGLDQVNGKKIKT